MKHERRAFHIEKGFPLPGGAPDDLAKYPFKQMEIGDSFQLAAEEHGSVRTSATMYSKKHPPAKFTVRMTDRAARAYRCWRTE